MSVSRRAFGAPCPGCLPQLHGARARDPRFAAPGLTDGGSGSALRRLREARDLVLGASDDRFVVSTGRPVHAILDVDLFEPSLVPGTCTSEPGGGNWRRAAGLLQSVPRKRIVVGAGVVDPAPDRGEEASALAAAGAAYGTTTGR